MDDAYTDTTDLLSAHWWRQLHMRLAPGLSAAELADFERRHAVRLPEDFAAYLRVANGFVMADTWDDCDDQAFVFLPLHEQYLLRGRFLKFCEWVVGLDEYAICVDPTGPLGTVVKLYGNEQCGVIATSFTDFAQLYVADGESLYRGAPAQRL